MEIKMQFYKD